MVCPSSGEVLDPLAHCRMLQARGAIKVEDLALTNLMRLTTFMARCDGEFHALEQAALADIIERYCLRFGGTEAMIAAALVETPRLAPEAADVVKALNAIRKMPNGRRFASFAIDACAQVIDADGRHSTEEVEWAVEVGNALRTLAARS